MLDNPRSRWIIHLFARAGDAGRRLGASADLR
jgi:hypothetical protein